MDAAPRQPKLYIRDAYRLSTTKKSLRPARIGRSKKRRVFLFLSKGKGKGAGFAQKAHTQERGRGGAARRRSEFEDRTRRRRADQETIEVVWDCSVNRGP